MSPLRAYTHTHIKIETDKSLKKLRQTTLIILPMSPLRVYTHTNSNVRSYMRNYMFCLLTESKQTTHVTSTCVLIAQLYIPSFHRFETDNSCHLYVCIHTLTSNLAQLYICRFTELKQTPLCVHTHTNIKRCSCLCNYIFCHLTESSLTTHVTSLCAAI